MCATICRTPGAHSRRLGFNGSAGETTRLSNSGIVSYSSTAKQVAVAARCARPGHAVVVCCSGITTRRTKPSIPAHRNVFSHPSSHHYLPTRIHSRYSLRLGRGHATGILAHTLSHRPQMRTTHWITISISRACMQHCTGTGQPEAGQRYRLPLV
jgi:hypothetical protein